MFSWLTVLLDRLPRRQKKNLSDSSAFDLSRCRSVLSYDLLGALSQRDSVQSSYPWRIHGAAIYGVPWIPSIYPLYVSINIPAPWIRHGLWDEIAATARFCEAESLINLKMSICRVTGSNEHVLYHRMMALIESKYPTRVCQRKAQLT